jgi:hypothetical protein
MGSRIYEEVSYRYKPKTGCAYDAFERLVIPSQQARVNNWGGDPRKYDCTRQEEAMKGLIPMCGRRERNQ